MTVNSLTLKIILIINKIADNTLIFKFEYPAVLTSPCNGNGDVRYKAHLIFILLRNPFIHRHNEPAAYETASERYGQTARNIGKSAACNKRLRFADSI